MLAKWSVLTVWTQNQIHVCSGSAALEYVPWSSAWWRWAGTCPCRGTWSCAWSAATACARRGRRRSATRWSPRAAAPSAPSWTARAESPGYSPETRHRRVQLRHSRRQSIDRVCTSRVDEQNERRCGTLSVGVWRANWIACPVFASMVLPCSSRISGVGLKHTSLIQNSS